MKGAPDDFHMIPAPHIPPLSHTQGASDVEFRLSSHYILRNMQTVYWINIEASWPHIAT